MPVGQGRQKVTFPTEIYLSRTGFFLSPFDSRSVNRAVSNVEGLKSKITAHKTFKNKFDQIRAGIKFIYIRDQLQRISTANLERVLAFFHAAMQANIFSINKLTNILFWRNIHSFVSIRSQLLNIPALICVHNRIGRTYEPKYTRNSRQPNTHVRVCIYAHTRIQICAYASLVFMS